MYLGHGTKLRRISVCLCIYLQYFSVSAQLAHDFERRGFHVVEDNAALVILVVCVAHLHEHLQARPRGLRLCSQARVHGDGGPKPEGPSHGKARTQDLLAHALTPELRAHGKAHGRQVVVRLEVLVRVEQALHLDHHQTQHRLQPFSVQLQALKTTHV